MERMHVSIFSASFLAGIIIEKPVAGSISCGG
jgi:hypothetical protein